MQDTKKQALDRLGKALQVMDAFNEGQLMGFGQAISVLGVAPRDRDIQLRALGLDRKEARP